MNVLAADVTCNLGTNALTIPGQIAGIIGAIYNLIKFGVPLLLIIFGMLDLGRAVISQKEDEIKKNQGIFVKRLIAAALVFFVFAIVQLLVRLVDDNGDTLMSCAKAILK